MPQTMLFFSGTKLVYGENSLVYVVCMLQCLAFTTEGFFFHWKELFILASILSSMH